MRKQLNNIPADFLTMEVADLPLDTPVYPKIYSTIWYEMYNQLVPTSGPAKTASGEVMRAVSKIEYRYYNDGDTINNIGHYSKGTAVNAYNFLTNAFSRDSYLYDFNRDLHDTVQEELAILFTDTDSKHYYECAIEDLKITIMKAILDTDRPYENTHDCTDDWDLGLVADELFTHTY